MFLRVHERQHSFDDAHTSLGPAMAKYYGLVCRQVLEPERWYELSGLATCTNRVSAG